MPDPSSNANVEGPAWTLDASETIGLEATPRTYPRPHTSQTMSRQSPAGHQLLLPNSRLSWLSRVLHQRVNLDSSGLGDSAAILVVTRVSFVAVVGWYVHLKGLARLL